MLLLLLLLPLIVQSEKFITYEVVPDVVSHPPRHELFVEWDSGAEATLGNELTPLQVKKKPRVSWQAEENEEYTLIMADPDAPSRENPTRREYLHWLVVNIPGTDVASGVTVDEYVGSGPPKGTGPHRYVLTIWKQNGTVTSDEYGGKMNRPLFRTMDFARIVTHEKDPRPVAGNFFEAQWDGLV